MMSTTSTAAIADACVRLGLSPRVAPSEVRAVMPGMRVTGRAAPVRHRGTVADLLAAIGEAAPGDVLVVDNDGRSDEACIGDLVALEAREAGLGGIVVWGLHRDTEEIGAIGLPVFSCGTTPAGPLEERAASAGTPRLGDVEVGLTDVIHADADGIVVVDRDHAEEVVRTAEEIARRERAQADAVIGGRSLREQFRFDEYLGRKRRDRSYDFREHLRTVGGAIET